MLIWVYTGLTGLAGLAFWKSGEKNRPASLQLSKAKQEAFERILNQCKDAEKLRTFAQLFRADGLEAQAIMLEKRAVLAGMPADVKKARREVFRKAKESKDPAAIRQVAQAFESQGSTGAAHALYEIAESLERNLNHGNQAVPPSEGHTRVEDSADDGASSSPIDETADSKIERNPSELDDDDPGREIEHGGASAGE